MKKFGNNKSFILSIAIILVFVALITFPLFHAGFPVTDDGEWMVIRLSAFYQSLAEGQFPVRFLGRLNYSFGYPVANFLYPGYLYVGSVFHILGLSFTWSVKAIVITWITMGSISLFLWLRKFFHTKESVFGTLSFLLMPYFWYDLYDRGSIGEIVATGTFFLVLYLTEAGLYLLLPPVLAFLLISHNSLALLFMLCYVGYIIVKKQWKAFVPLVLGGVIASFFWLPALVERSFVIFDQVIVSNPQYYFGISNTLLLWSLPTILVIGFLGTRQQKLFSRERSFFIIIFFLSTFLISGLSSFIWNIPALTKIIQFPYRFFSLWFIVVPWLFAWILATQKQEKWKWGIACLVLSTGLIFSTGKLTKINYIYHDEGFYTTNEATTTVLDEYMPTWVIQKPDRREYKRLVFFTGKGEIIPRKETTQTIDAAIIAKEDSMLQVNTIFYPGWGATLDGKPIEIDYQNEGGVIRIHVPQGEHQLLVEFRETIVRFFADFLSGVGIVLYIIFVTHAFLKRKKKK